MYGLGVGLGTAFRCMVSKGVGFRVMVKGLWVRFRYKA